jgi:hypothetical protein
LPENKIFMKNRLFGLITTFVIWSACALTFAQNVAPQPLITERVDNSRLVVLTGNTHPLAQSLTDLGAASPNLTLHRMLLVLKRSPAQESALTQLIDEQQEKESQSYHQWLTPAQFGAEFGAAPQDIQTVTSWLQSVGFQVTQVSQSRNIIEFSGTAGQVQAAFHTTIHSYMAADGPHWANASDPSIPAALAPVVAGVESLNNFPKKATNAFAGVYSEITHKVVARPQFTQECETNSGPTPCFGVSPWDFATIYDVLPLWNGTPAIDGTGETIAIVGRSNINSNDISTFRNLFDLPPADANHLQIILNGPDPGLTGDESEADIDVQWSGAVAKNAKIDFVVSESTETSDGVDLSALYVIDNNLAPIMSESFGSCEAGLGTSGNAFFQELWEQAAAQGISVFISSGDNGAAGCDESGPPPSPAVHGLAVSGIASTPFNVAVGGTDFNDATNPFTFWNSTNDPTTQASALGYIPETTWNNSCTNSLLQLLGGTTNAETNCNNAQFQGFVSAVGGSGGASAIYPKPAWQTGTGISDGHRDIPDVSLFASNGFVGNFYVICEADITNGFCDLNDLAGFGGTSVSTPAFAGIMALADQQMGITTSNANFRQGNPNYVLYKLAANKPSAFHDVPTGSTIAMPCQTGTPNCTTNVAGHQFGVLSGYATTTGYDLATGWGSVDANALVTNWSSVSFSASSTAMTAPSPVSITHGAPLSTTITVSAVPPATGIPTGDVSLLTSTGQSVGRFTLTGGVANATTNTIPGGTQTLIAHYEGDGTFGGSDSAPSSSITVTPEASKSTMALETFTLTGTQTSGNATTAVYGSVYLLRVNVTNSAGTACSPTPIGQSACPTGTVSLTDNSNPLDGGSFVLNTLGYTEDQFIELSGGSHSLQANYGGDSSFNASLGTDNITITPATTTFTAFNVPTTGTTKSTISINATVSAQSFGAQPTGTMTFFSDGVSLGSTNGTGSSGSATGTATFSVNFAPTISTAGNHTITATYNGDTNYSSSNSQPAPIKIGLPPPTVTAGASAQTINAGDSVTLTALVDSQSAGPAITGTVNFTYVGSGDVIPGTVTLTPGTDTSGNPTLQASLTLVPTGAIQFDANYSGDSNYPAAESGSSVSISVNGNDFSISVPSPVTAQRGVNQSLRLTVNGESGYAGTIQFTPASCSGLPSEATCSFNPPSVTGAGVTVINIATTAPHIRINKQAEFLGGPRWWVYPGSGMLSCILLLGVPKKKRWNKMFSLVVFALVMISVACGGGSSSGGGGGGGVTDPGTPTGTYTVTVTATDGTHTHSTTFNLTVQ